MDREGSPHYTPYKYSANPPFPLAGHRPVSLSPRPRSSEGEVEHRLSSSSAPPSRISHLKPSLFQSFYNNNPSILEEHSKYIPRKQEAPNPRPASRVRFSTGATPSIFDEFEIQGHTRRSSNIQTRPSITPTSLANITSKESDFEHLSTRPIITPDFDTNVPFIGESSISRTSSTNKTNSSPSVYAASTTPVSYRNTPKLSDEYRSPSKFKSQSASSGHTLSNMLQFEQLLTKQTLTPEYTNIQESTEEFITQRPSTSSHYYNRASYVKPTRPSSPGNTFSKKSPSVRRSTRQSLKPVHTTINISNEDITTKWPSWLASKFRESIDTIEPKSFYGTRSTRQSLSPDYTKPFSDSEDETESFSSDNNTKTNPTSTVFLVRPSDRSENTSVKESDFMDTSTRPRLWAEYPTAEYLANKLSPLREIHAKVPLPGPPVMITTTPTDARRYSPIASHNYVYQRPSSPTKTNTSSTSNEFLIKPIDKSGNKASDFMHMSTRPKLSLEYPTSEYLANKLSPPRETHAMLPSPGSPVVLTTTPTDAWRHSPTESPNYDYQSSSSPSLIFREHGIINPSADKIAMKNHPRAKSPKNIVLGHPAATFHETRSLDSSPPILKQTQYIIKPSSTPIIEELPAMTSPKNIDLGRPPSKMSSPSASPSSTRFKQHNAINPSLAPKNKDSTAVRLMKNIFLGLSTPTVHETIVKISPSPRSSRFEQHGAINPSSPPITMAPTEMTSQKNTDLGSPISTTHEKNGRSSLPWPSRPNFISNCSYRASGMTSPAHTRNRPSSPRELQNMLSFTGAPLKRSLSPGDPPNNPSFTRGRQQRPSPQGRQPNRPSSTKGPQKRSSSAPPIYRSSMTSSNHGWPSLNLPSKRFSMSSLAGCILVRPAPSRQISRYGEGFFRNYFSNWEDQRSVGSENNL